MKKTSYLIAGAFIFLSIFMFAGNVQAAEDNSAPQVTAISITPATVDTGDAAQVITLTITVTDDLTGACFVSPDDTTPTACGNFTGQSQMRLRPLIGTQFIDFTLFTRISGDANNGTYTSTTTVPRYGKVGLWTVESLWLYDKIGNADGISGVELAALFPNSNLSIANTDDSTSVTIEKEWNFNSSTAKVKFSEGTVVTNFTGGLYQFYQMVNQEYDVDESAGIDGVVAAVRVGIPGVSLIFDKDVEISLYIPNEELIGELLIIQTRNEGDEDWSRDLLCTIDLDQYCTFNVRHASYFAAQVAPVRAIVTGTKLGGGPEVRVYDTTGEMLSNFDAYTNWWGGINVAVGDINGDGTNEIITSTRNGGIPTIRIFDINGNNIGWDFDAYAAGFRGGISLTVGDIEGDGIDEIVVAAMSGGGPNIRTFGYRNGEIVSVTENFMAYDENFRGGISISIGDLEGDGIGEIITTPISGGGPHIRVFGSRSGVFVPVTLGVMAYAENFHGGITTCTADLNGNGKDEIVTGIFSAGGPHVRAIGIGSNGALALSNPGFMAFGDNFRGGVSVAALDTNGNGQEEIIAAVGGLDVGHIKIMSADGTLLSPSFQAYGNGYHGGVTVAAGVF